MQMAKEIGVSVDSVKYYVRKMRCDKVIAREWTSQKGKWIVLRNNEANDGNIATNGLDVSKPSEQTIRTDIQTTTQTTIRTINENTEEKILFLIKRNPRITQVQLASKL